MPRATDRSADDALAVRQSLVGAWSLLECAELQQDGAKRLPLGEHALGQVIYTTDGRMSAQLVRAGRAPFPSDDYRDAPVEDVAETFQQHFGTFGAAKQRSRAALGACDFFDRRSLTVDQFSVVLSSTFAEQTSLAKDLIAAWYGVL